MMNTIKLVTYNVLAPCWAQPSYYPTSSAQYLDKVTRRVSIINVLKDLAKTNDVIALQETQEDEIVFFKETLSKEGFSGFNVNHKDDYWSKYIVADPPFVSNGVALFWNNRTTNLLEVHGYNFSNSGNRGIIAYLRKNNKLFRIVKF